MAETWLKDSVGSKSQMGKMKSGLQHCADSLIGGREGTAVLRFGSPGSPLEKSTMKSSGYMGAAPDLFGKFQKKGQR